MDEEQRLRGIEAQCRNEAYAVELGVARHRAMTQDMGVGGTPAGSALIRDMMAGLVPALVADREAAFARLLDGTNGPKGDHLLLHVIPRLRPEVMAYITCRVALDTPRTLPYPDGRRGAIWSTAALAIADALRDEMEVAAWRYAERERTKDTDYQDLYKEMTSRTTLDRRQWSRWRKKIATIEKMEWPLDQRSQFGGHLLGLLVKHGGGHWEALMVRRTVRTTRGLFLTDEGYALYQQRNDEAEVSRPFGLPMVCPPRPWTIEDTP